MAVSINGRFAPLRMVLARREPVQFSLSVKNEDEAEKKYTVKVLLSPQLAFTKGGFKNTELIRIDSIKPGEEKTAYFDLYPKGNATAREETVRVRVQEHFSNYQYTKNQYEADFTLVVE